MRNLSGKLIGTSTQECVQSVGQAQTSSEMQTAIYECLVCYWIRQGIPRHCAEFSAEQALVKIETNKSKGTWCLLCEHPTEQQDYVENSPPEANSRLVENQYPYNSLTDYYETFPEPVVYYQERLLAEISILQARVNKLHNLIRDSYMWSPAKKGAGMHENRLQWIAELEEQQALISLYFRLLRSQEFKAKR